MKKILTNNIGPGKGQPFGKRSIEHMQAGFNESISATVEAVNRGRKQVVYLTGCTVASAASQHHNEAGWAYCNGEVFQVLEGVVNSPGAPVWVVEEVFENGGAVPFSNLEFHDILAVRRLKLAVPGTAGGIALDQAAAYSTLLATMHTHSFEDISGLDEAIGGKADAAQPQKIDAPFTTGENYMDNPAAQYFKDTLGFVHLSGIRVIKRADIDPVNPSAIFVLPAGLRPAQRVTFQGFSLSWQKVVIKIETNGNVMLHVDFQEYSAQNIDYHITFDGMYFKA